MKKARIEVHAEIVVKVHLLIEVDDPYEGWLPSRIVQELQEAVGFGGDFPRRDEWIGREISILTYEQRTEDLRSPEALAKKLDEVYQQELAKDALEREQLRDLKK